MNTEKYFAISDTADLKSKFVLFSKFGDKSADGSTIKLTQARTNKIRITEKSSNVLCLNTLTFTSKMRPI